MLENDLNIENNRFKIFVKHLPILVLIFLTGCFPLMIGMVAADDNPYPHLIPDPDPPAPTPKPLHLKIIKSSASIVFSPENSIVMSENLPIEVPLGEEKLTCIYAGRGPDFVSITCKNNNDKEKFYLTTFCVVDQHYQQKLSLWCEVPGPTCYKVKDKYPLAFLQCDAYSALK